MYTSRCWAAAAEVRITKLIAATLMSQLPPLKIALELYI